ncbi:hypothetical protein ATE92_2599 [Ulvibacter sp. MAR_2010_11]|uniref:CPBP family intramembrane glutamic endopeptidase n=1 Tax=Ulvibacter sp. MAR_2010_11 TaxID=1250229 RepID=UPI000C2C36B2|nr:type II CAAX endopeptidase family protein [Ulvibacter sp. MAR_2010_11]PKA84410.1 hypothetical protein ATE92_2599 [Ulvibacter sp. MAR_2010_11]
MKNTIKVALIVFMAFAVYYLLDELYFKSVRKVLFDATGQFGLSHIITYIISGIPLYLGTFLLNKNTSVFKSLGLSKSVTKALLFALLCTLPLFIGFSFVFDFNAEINLNTILVSVIAAGFFEELFFRGFLFGQLFKNSRFGFIPSVFFGALFFGLIHLYQSTDVAELIGIFAITFLGGILFSWVYAEWNYNIWVPVFLHMLMNLAWELFSVSDTALGGVYANVFRGICIFLIITLTVVYKKQNRKKLEINKSTIWMKKRDVILE